VIVRIDASRAQLVLDRRDTRADDSRSYGSSYHEESVGNKLFDCRCHVSHDKRLCVWRLQYWLPLRALPRIRPRRARRSLGCAATSVL